MTSFMRTSLKSFFTPPCVPPCEEQCESSQASHMSLRHGESSGDRRALRLRTKVIQKEQYLKMFFSNYDILEV